MRSWQYERWQSYERAFEAGYDAARNGDDFNPYSWGSSLQEAYQRGYQAGRRAA